MTDPLDLDAFRENGYQLIDWIADYLGGLEDRPVLEPVSPGDVRAKMPAAAPRTGEPFSALMRDLDEIVAPGMTHWQHPNWFAYFPASSSPASILAELAAAGIGAQGMLWSTGPAITEVESHVLDWLVDLTGAPQNWKTTSTGGGVIQISASDSTHTALVVAREECRKRSGASAEQMVAYTSSQAHSSVEKGAIVAGFGHIRLIDVDEEFAQRPDALQAAIEADIAAGLTPAFVCAAVGTTGTTAIDPVRAIGEIGRAHDMWVHVDAAYAGSAMMCPEFRRLQDGLELVDSYTFNPHKWLFTSWGCSVFWVADRKPLIDTLSIAPPYLRNAATDSGDVIDYRDWHVPLGHHFRALKLWWVLRSFGVEGIQSMLRAHISWANDFATWVEDQPELEIFAPNPLALVCFRHRGGSEATQALATAINADGSVYVTPSLIGDDAFIRVSIGSTSTEQRHVLAFQEKIKALL